jgi:hypothetical protein
VQWERDTLQPKYPLAAGLSAVKSGGTIELVDYQLFLSPLLQPEPRMFVQPRRALDALGAKYFVIPKESVADQIELSSEGLGRAWLEPPWSPERPQLVPEGDPLASAVDDPQEWLGTLDEDIDVLANGDHFPAVWIVRDLHLTPPIASSDRQRLMPMLESILFPLNTWIDLRTAAWVESTALLEFAGQSRMQIPPPENADESCRITSYEPQRVEIEARLQAPGLVVLSDTYYPGWELTVESPEGSEQPPILRTNRVMRGALLPPGEHKLIYEYHPRSFYRGAAISAIAWPIVAILCVLSLRRRQGRSTA